MLKLLLARVALRSRFDFDATALDQIMTVAL